MSSAAVWVDLRDFSLKPQVGGVFGLVIASLVVSAPSLVLRHFALAHSKTIFQACNSSAMSKSLLRSVCTGIDGELLSFNMIVSILSSSLDRKVTETFSASSLVASIGGKCTVNTGELLVALAPLGTWRASMFMAGEAERRIVKQNDGWSSGTTNVQAERWTTGSVICWRYTLYMLASYLQFTG